MKKSSNNASSGAGKAGAETPTKYARDETPTKYAKEDTPTKYAREDTPTKYARELTPTKYAKAETPTKYSKSETPTKYAKSDTPTKYAKADTPTKYIKPHSSQVDGGKASLAEALEGRRVVDAAIEEALVSATAAVDRVHPGIGPDARAKLAATLLDQFGSRILEAHLNVVRNFAEE